MPTRRPRIDADVEVEVNDCVEFADNSPNPSPDQLFAHAYATPVANAPHELPGDPLLSCSERRPSVAVITYRQALNDTLRAGADPRPECVLDGRGDRCLRGVLQNHRWAAHRVRSGTGARHPDRRRGIRRCSDRRRDAQVFDRSSRS